MIIAALATLAWCALLVYEGPDCVGATNDSQRYLGMGACEPQALPFAARVLAPAVCGESFAWWAACAALSNAAFAASLYWYAQLLGLGDGGAAMAVGLSWGLPGLYRYSMQEWIGVDAPARALALSSACCCLAGAWEAGVLLGIAAGVTKETAPVFAAVFAWSPLPLLGLLAPAVLWFVHRSRADSLGDPSGVLGAPWATAREHRQYLLTHAGLMVMPWGFSLAALLKLDTVAGVALGLAYAQVLVATDEVRLYQWAAPPVVVAAAGVLPADWLLVVVVAQVAHPWGRLSILGDTT